MAVQRTPKSEAVRPTRRAISPRLAMRTEVMGVTAEAERCRVRAEEVRRARARARDREAGIIGEAYSCEEMLNQLKHFFILGVDVYFVFDMSFLGGRRVMLQPLETERVRPAKSGAPRKFTP
jgi:hypothetical protein